MNEAVEAAAAAIEEAVATATPSRRVVIVFAASAIIVMALWITFLVWLLISFECRRRLVQQGFGGAAPVGGKTEPGAEPDAFVGAPAAACVANEP